MPFDSQDFVIPAAIETDDVLRCLQDARQWLSDPTHWYQADYFCGSEGQTCVVGALGLIVLDDPEATSVFDHPVTRAAIQLLSDAMSAPVMNPHYPEGEPARHVSWFNDTKTTTHADILALFDRAIAARRAELLAEQAA